MTASSFDVVIIGAGIAGLISARALAERGLHVCVVEARERIGGRILTRRIGTEVVELGAEFVHGRPPDLLTLIDEAGLALVERTGSQVHASAGLVHTDEEDGDARTWEPLERLGSLTGPDVSFRDYLQRYGGDLDAAHRKQLLSYVEGFNAADASEISARSLGIQQAAEEAIQGDRLAHVREGYDRLPAFVADRVRAAGGRVRCGVSVQAVNWSVGHVSLHTTAGEFVAPKAILTLPLSVLEAGHVRISPEPLAVLAAAAQMRMGHVSRFSLLFRDAFWRRLPPLEQLSFLFSPEELPPVWWTSHPEPGRTLTGWVGGPRATPLLLASEQELTTRAVRALARILSQSETAIRDQLEACLTHAWTVDPHALGAYSYVGVGGVEASAAMSEPVEHTLFFAGEHTDTTGHWGTVHGAMRSGLRAAAQVLTQRPPGR